MTTPASLKLLAYCLFMSITTHFDSDVNVESNLENFRAQRVMESFEELDGVIKFTFKDIKYSG